MTAGSAVKPGAPLMKPPRRTQRLILSRSPSAAFAWASTFRSASRAAAAPSSGLTSPPTLPL